MEQQGSEVQHSQVSSSKPGMLSGDSLENVLLQVSYRLHREQKLVEQREQWTARNGGQEGGKVGLGEMSMKSS